MEALREKLAAADGTQDDVTAISAAALALPASEHGAFAEAWLDCVRAQPGKLLELFYIANDVVQKSKMKQVDSILGEFALVLTKSLEKVEDRAVVPKLLRVLGLWEERGVFKGRLVRRLKRIVARATSDNPLFEFDDDISDFSGSDKGSDDEDEDHDDDGGAPTLLKRQDSTASLAEVTLPRLLITTKSKEASCEELLAKVETLNNEAQAKLEPHTADGKLDEAYLSKLEDGQVEAMLSELRRVLQHSREASEALGQYKALEGGLITVLENQMDVLADKSAAYDAKAAESAELLERLAKLAAAHEGSEAIKTTITTERKVLRTTSRKRSRGDSDSSASESSGGEEEEEEEEGAEGEGAAGAANGSNGAAADGGVFKLAKRKKKKKKKKTAQERKEEEELKETPMMYNKILKCYVPMPRSGEGEDWREH